MEDTYALAWAAYEPRGCGRRGYREKVGLLNRSIYVKEDLTENIRRVLMQEREKLNTEFSLILLVGVRDPILY